MRMLGVLVAGILIAAQPFEAAHRCPELEDWVPLGNIDSSVIVDDVLYYSIGATLMIAEISDRSAPRIIGKALLGGHTANSMVVVDGFAYVGVRQEGLRVVDVRNPSEAREVGFFRPTPYIHCHDLAVVGDIAYVAMGLSFYVVDVSSPEEPKKLREIWLGTGNGYFKSIVVRDDLAYFATYQNLRIYDVSNPEMPTEVGSYTVPDHEIHDVALSGDHAFVASWEGGLRVLDISDPSLPVEVGVFLSDNWVEGVRVDNDRGFLNEGTGHLSQTPYGMRILDLSSPQSPAEIAFYDTEMSISHIHVGGSLVSVSTNILGLRILDISDPGAPVEIASVDPPNQPVDIDAESGIAAITTRRAGVRLVDFRDPPLATEIEPLEDSDSVWNVAVKDGIAYLADLEGDLRVVDISVPEDPREIGRLPPTPYPDNYAYGIEVEGDLAYLLHRRGMKIVDVSRPDSPVELGDSNAPFEPNDLAVSDGFAFLTAWYNHLRVIDARSPVFPAQIASFELPGRPGGLAVADDFAYVVMSNYVDRLGLRVIDVSDPAALVEVGALEGFAATDIEIRNGVAYIAALGSGLIVADVRDPSTPILMGSFDTPGTADNVALDQQHAVLGDHKGGGVMVFDTSSCVPPLASPRRPGGRQFPGGGPSCDEQNRAGTPPIGTVPGETNSTLFL